MEMNKKSIKKNFDEKIRKLTIADNYMFFSVMTSNDDICKEVVEICIGRAVYRFCNRERDDRDLTLEDGSYKILINARRDESGCSEGMRQLMAAARGETITDDGLDRRIAEAGVIIGTSRKATEQGLFWCGPYFFDLFSVFGSKIRVYFRLIEDSMKGAFAMSGKIRNNRSMKVCEMNGYKYRTVPGILLKGKWLREFGFHPGDAVTVECHEGVLTITKAECEDAAGGLMMVAEGKEDYR